MDDADRIMREKAGHADALASRTAWCPYCSKRVISPCKSTHEAASCLNNRAELPAVASGASYL